MNIRASSPPLTAVSLRDAAQIAEQASSDPHRLWAFDPEEQWEDFYSFGPEPRFFPSADGSELYVGLDQHLAVLDAQTGEVKADLSSEISFTDWQTVSPDRELIFQAQDKAVAARDARTGTERWSFDGLDEHELFGRAAPALSDDDTLYVGTSKGHVIALDAVTGEEKWKIHTGSFHRASPAISPEGRLFVATLGADAPLLELDPKTGEQRREVDIPGHLSSDLYTSPEGNLIFQRYREDTGHDLVAMSPDGEEQWAFNAPDGGGEHFPPARGPEGHLWVTTTKGTLYELDQTDGEVLTDIPTGEDLRSAPVVGPNGVVYARNFDQEVLAFVRDTAKFESQVFRATSDDSPRISIGARMVTIGGIQIPIRKS